MHQTLSHQRVRGFTLIEIMVSGAISTAVGIAVFAFLNAGMYLTAKNLSLNYTSNQMRTALDRVENVLQQGDTAPALIDTNGAATTGSAAGIKLDRFIGGPWVVTTSSGTIASTATSLTITRSTNSFASPPIPVTGDVINIDGTAASFRPRVSGSATADVVDSSLLRETMTYPLTSALGTTVTNNSGTLTAKIVRQVAFIVMSNGAKRELRYYPSFETTTNLNDSTKYNVITDQVGTQTADITPFSITTNAAGDNLVNFSLRVGTRQYNQVLANKQRDEYNTFSRIESVLRPKSNP